MRIRIYRNLIPRIIRQSHRLVEFDLKGTSLYTLDKTIDKMRPKTLTNCIKLASRGTCPLMAGCRFQMTLLALPLTVEGRKASTTVYGVVATSYIQARAGGRQNLYLYISTVPATVHL
jgi:hypothetical protein